MSVAEVSLRVILDVEININTQHQHFIHVSTPTFGYTFNHIDYAVENDQKKLNDTVGW